MAFFTVGSREKTLFVMQLKQIFGPSSYVRALRPTTRFWLGIMFESAANAQLKIFKNDRQMWVGINIIFLVIFFVIN